MYRLIVSMLSNVCIAYGLFKLIPNVNTALVLLIGYTLLSSLVLTARQD